MPETLPAAEITSASATLEGWLGAEALEPEEPREPVGAPESGEGAPRVDPEIVPASWYFEYAPGASCTGIGYVATPEHVARFKNVNQAMIAVTGLQPGTEYTACLVSWHTALPGVSFTTLAEVGAPPAPAPPVMIGSSDNPSTSLMPVPVMDGTSKSKVTGKTRLAKALKTCARRPKSKRASCDKRARKRYAARRR
ncbi:MAG TPA: hypothetical protein VGX69_10145 [Solirubrobacteraceae bacterium]|nr:hypothetical protein [Solirubrobacteraceae bacterium]